jgi:hypothetical protein
MHKTHFSSRYLKIYQAWIDKRAAYCLNELS